MSRFSLPPMPRFATPTERPIRETATISPAEHFPRAEELPRTLTHEDLLLRVPPAPRATHPVPVPITFATPAPTLPPPRADEGLTDDDIAFLRHIAETPDAHACAAEEGTSMPRGLILGLLDELEARSAPAPADTTALQERIVALVRRAYHDAFVAVGGSMNLLIIESVFDASQARVEMDQLIDQMRAGTT